MTTANPINGSFLKTGAAAALALAAIGFAGVVQARDNVSFSFGVGVNNAYPVYTQQPVFVQQQPVYVQPQYVYVQPAPIYVAPRQVYYSQPAYSSPQPVYYNRPHGHGQRGGYYQQNPWDNGYSQIYYQRGGRHHERD